MATAPKPNVTRFTASDGTDTIVYSYGATRWYYEDGKRMMLPSLPNSSHGRYLAARIAAGLKRREYRQLCDDYMVERI